MGVLGLQATEANPSPCPCCGYTSSLETMKSRKGWEADIHCDDCMLSMHTITYDTERQAIDAALSAWNRRVKNGKEFVMNEQAEIRNRAMKDVMWRNNHTNNDVTRYIADAVAEKVVSDERQERASEGLVFDSCMGESGFEEWKDFFLLPTKALTDLLEWPELLTGKEVRWVGGLVSGDGHYELNDILTICVIGGEEDSGIQYTMSEREKTTIRLAIYEREIAKMQNYANLLSAELREYEM